MFVDAKEHSEPEPATIWITIDGTNVKVEDLPVVQIYSTVEDVWTFGGVPTVRGVYYGQINRITGQAEVMIVVTKSISLTESQRRGGCR